MSLAILLAGVSAIYVTALSTSTFVLTTAVAGLVAFGAGVVLKRMPLSVLGLGVLLTAYASVLLATDISIVQAMVFSAAFFGLCELGFWALEPDAPTLPTEVVLSRLGVTLLMMVGAGMLGLLLMIAAYYVSGPSPWVALLGILALVSFGALGAKALDKVR